MFSNLQAEMYWLYANLDIFSPYSTQVLHFLIWHFRKCKATCERMLFLKRCMILKHTWAREKEKKEEGGRGSADRTVH